MTWEIVFMLLLLKIPIVYTCVVVWWAIKAEPTPPELAVVAVPSDTPPSGGSPRREWQERRRPTRPHTPGLRSGNRPARPKHGVTA